MNIAVIGTGYVGLVVGACLSETGHDVICVDIDERKIASLNEGSVSIYEPGLEELVRHNLAEKRLEFTTEIERAVRASSIIFIAVGTPQGAEGSAELKHVLSVAASIGRAMDGERIVITKSTVPVGTAAKVRAAIEAETEHPVHVCSNPEFLKEGGAVRDFMKPDRVVLGVDGPETGKALRELYAPFLRTGNEILLMDVASAEITKYAANAMLATRISFMNAIAQLCEVAGADVDQVRLGIGSDGRIGPAFLFPGAGYGGSCLVGRETLVVRRDGRAEPRRLDALWRDLRSGGPGVASGGHPGVIRPERMEALSWSMDEGVRWRPVAAVTRRRSPGEAVTVRTAMGRSVRCTPDHPFVVRARRQEARPVIKLAEELGTDDWLPLAVGAPIAVDTPRAAAVAVSAVPHAAVAAPGSAEGGESLGVATGFLRSSEAIWVRVVSSSRRPHEGWVYSLDVPGTETFVTTGGLVVHNCFPKDVEALIQTSRQMGTDASIMAAVGAVNDRQKRVLLQRVVERFGEDLSGQTFALWGLSFKPLTDDMREAPSIVTIEGLLERGARLVAHDPAAINEARKLFRDRIEYREQNYGALAGARALIIHTEWHPYRYPNFLRMKESLAEPVIFDGRNLYPPEKMRELGFEYHSIGRGPVVPEG